MAKYDWKVIRTSLRELAVRLEEATNEHGLEVIKVLPAGEDESMTEASDRYYYTIIARKQIS